MTVFRPNLGQILADKGMPDSFESDNSRPPAPASLSGPMVEWCKLSLDDQVVEVEERAFERQLSRETLKRHELGWEKRKLEAYLDRHRRIYRQERYARSRLDDAPCKNWRSKAAEAGCDPTVLRILDSVWATSSLGWSHQYPYLMAPGRPCECAACNPAASEARVSENERDGDLGLLSGPGGF